MVNSVCFSSFDRNKLYSGHFYHDICTFIEFSVEELGSSFAIWLDEETTGTDIELEDDLVSIEKVSFSIN